MTTDFNETPGTSRYRKPGTSLTELWRTKPIFKLLVIGIVVGGAAWAANSYFSKNTKVETSVLPAPAANTSSSAATAGEVSPEYVKAVETQNQTRAEQATESGTSALPTPMQSAVMNPAISSVVEQNDQDPLKEFEESITPKMRTSSTSAIPVAPVVPAVPPEAVQALARQMQAQMQQVQREWAAPAMSTVRINEARDEAGGSTSARAADGGAQTYRDSYEGKTYIPAGSVLYGQMLTEANSDVPGPILGQMLSGPLAGARLVGSFQTFRNHLVIEFKTISFRRKTIKASILALDPNTTLGGVASEVDPRYLTRVILPAAAEFLKGFSSALSEDQTSVAVTGTGSTQITQSSTQEKTTKDALFDGMEKASDRVTQFMNEEASATKRLVRVAVGTPIALLFVKAVTECDLNEGCKVNVQ